MLMFLLVKGLVSAKRFFGCGGVFVAVAVELIWEEECFFIAGFQPGSARKFVGPDVGHPNTEVQPVLGFSEIHYTPEN